MANALRRRCTVTRRPSMTSVLFSTTRVRAGDWSQISVAGRHCTVTLMKRVGQSVAPTGQGVIAWGLAYPLALWPREPQARTFTVSGLAVVVGIPSTYKMKPASSIPRGSYSTASTTSLPSIARRPPKITAVVQFRCLSRLAWRKPRAPLRRPRRNTRECKG